MKTIATLLLFFSSTLCLMAQPKQAPKPATTPPATARPAAPRTPPPYVLKKDFEDGMASINTQIRSVAAGTNGLRGEIHAKDEAIDKLSTQMGRVEEILNSTAFKVANTSDSLNQTRFSVEEFRKNTEAHLQKQDEAMANAMMIIWVVLGLAVLLPVLIFIIMNSKVNKLNSAMNTQTLHMETKIADHAETSAALVKNETRSQRTYTDGELSSMKLTASRNLKTEVDRLTEELNAVREQARLQNEDARAVKAEIKRLQDRLSTTE